MFGKCTSCFSVFVSVINSVLLCWTITIVNFKKGKTSFQQCCSVSCCISVRSLVTLLSTGYYVVCHGWLQQLCYFIACFEAVHPVASALLRYAALHTEILSSVLQYPELHLFNTALFLPSLSSVNWMLIQFIHIFYIGSRFYTDTLKLLLKKRLHASSTS